MPQMIDKQLVHNRFGKSLGSYDNEAVVQQSMARELCAMICQAEPARSFDRVLEVGSGTGTLMAELLGCCSVKSYYANDLVEETLFSLRKLLLRFPVAEFHFIGGDIESCDSLPANLDLVLSGATLQWLDDLEGFFRKMADQLQPGGVLAFSTFSTSNMREISTIENVGLNYHTLGELELLAGRYFDLTSSWQEEKRVEFSSPEAVLHHIRQTGTNGLLRRSWSKSRYQHFVERYRELFSCEKGVYLTYHPVYCCLKKRVP